jgi:predicted P-loop ATPase
VGEEKRAREEKKQLKRALAIFFIFWTVQVRKLCSRILVRPTMRAVRRPWSSFDSAKEGSMVSFRPIAHGLQAN